MIYFSFRAHPVTLDSDLIYKTIERHNDSEIKNGPVSVVW